MTEADVLALPVNGGYDITTDPKTGYTLSERRPIFFLVREDGVFDYRLSDGSRWFVGRAANGQIYRERRSEGC